VGEFSCHLLSSGLDFYLHCPGTTLLGCELQQFAALPSYRHVTLAADSSGSSEAPEFDADDIAVSATIEVAVMNPAGTRR
jgi:hypothetical protein